MIAMAIGMPSLAWLEYDEVAEIHDTGKEGALSILADTGTTRSRKGRDTHYYDASLSGMRVRLRTSHSLSSGYRYPVIFLPEKLKDYSVSGTGVFYAYKFGNKRESKWEIFVREFGENYLWIMAGLEVLWFVGAYLFWNSYRKGEES